MKFSDVNDWKRKMQYENFIGYDKPVFSITTRLDVTKPYLYCKENGLSFFSFFLYVLSDCVNGIEEYRYRIVHGKVLEYEKVDPSFVILRDDEKIVARTTPFEGDFKKFYAENRATIERERKNLSDDRFGTERYDCFYVSCLSFMDVVSFSNPYNYRDASNASIPRFTWGKCVEKNGRYETCFDVSLHHALCDGVHVAKLINALNAVFADVEGYIKRQIGKGE
ncbi:MAG: hypothetical protein J6Y44_03450 [Clostridia bacterium]|nr:hypothetical protein [Clostridia bacterium]